MNDAIGRGVLAAQGFRAAGVAGGLKEDGGLDVALVVNDGPTRHGAAVLTSNRVHAAPVSWTREVVSDGKVAAVVLNSGGANACTGPQGHVDTQETAREVATLINVPASDVAVCSTGLIGEPLNMSALIMGIHKAHAALGSDDALAAAQAIMTTDTVPKTAERRLGSVTVGGMAKGAGMLAPGLATMLVVITTDVRAESHELNHVLGQACTETFDRIDSDGCMSTNDAVILMSSGASGSSVGGEISLAEVQQLVTDVCADLAQQLIRDAEGASKDIRIEVVGAATVDDAVTVGRSVARSNLFKCAIHGEDPNWGRVLSAVGTTDARFDPEELGVAINGVWVAKKGAAAADRSLVDLSQRAVNVTVDLAAGNRTAAIWTNDLTAAYVHENSAYSS